MNGTLNLIKKWYVSPIKFVLLLCHSILQAGHYLGHRFCGWVICSSSSMQSTLQHCECRSLE